MGIKKRLRKEEESGVRSARIAGGGGHAKIRRGMELKREQWEAAAG